MVRPVYRTAATPRSRSVVRPVLCRLHAIDFFLDEKYLKKIVIRGRRGGPLMVCRDRRGGVTPLRD